MPSTSSVRALADDNATSSSADTPAPSSPPPAASDSPEVAPASRAQAQAEQQPSSVTEEDTGLALAPDTTTKQHGGSGLRQVMVAVLAAMVAFAVVMIAFLLLLMRRNAARSRQLQVYEKASEVRCAAHPEFRSGPTLNTCIKACPVCCIHAYSTTSMCASAACPLQLCMYLKVYMAAVQGAASQGVAAGDSGVVHVEAGIAEEATEGSSAQDYQVVHTNEPTEQDDPVLTDNSIFIQNLWEQPPTTGGFYLEDIIEERTADLAPSGYVITPSGKIANSTQIASAALDNLPRSIGDREFSSPAKKLAAPIAEQNTQHRSNSLSSSLHQSLQSSTEHSLHDSLSDG